MQHVPRVSRGVVDVHRLTGGHVSVQPSRHRARGKAPELTVEAERSRPRGPPYQRRVVQRAPKDVNARFRPAAPRGPPRPIARSTTLAGRRDQRQASTSSRTFDVTTSKPTPAKRHKKGIGREASVWYRRNGGVRREGPRRVLHRNADGPQQIGLLGIEGGARRAREPRGKVSSHARETTDEEEQQGDRWHRGQRHEPHVAARHGGLPVRHPQENHVVIVMVQVKAGVPRDALPPCRTRAKAIGRSTPRGLSRPWPTARAGTRILAP